MSVTTPWSTVGLLTYKRTYSREIPGENRTEEFPETVDRVIKSAREQLNVGFTPEEENRLNHYLLSLKGSVAGRFLWQMGTETVDRLGLASLQNCAFTVVDSPVVPFTWTMDMLALGSGVGYNLQNEYVNKLPPVKDWFEPPTRVDNNGADYIIPDSREGWVKFLAKVLKSAFLSEKPSKGTFTYSTLCIRSKGAPIKGFGGVASGPEDLVKGIGQISDILYKLRGQKLRPIHVLDIMNILGQIIVAGNVRRSAQIAIGDADDIEFLKAKRWDLGSIPSWRAMSNNSVVADSMADLPREFWETYEGEGEPYGLINLSLAQRIGRLGDTSRPDPTVRGFNPCAEQGLAPYETCCLAEVFLPNIESKTELLDLCTMLYRINKHSLAMECHHPETEEIVHQNMRMGIGMTGVLQASEEQKGWLSDVYEELVAYDKKYSAKNGFNESVKLTTVKPSGTLSLLPGVTPGIHPAYAQYMIRRITVATDHPLIEVCKSHGYPIEFKRNFDGSNDQNSMIVSFPFSYPEGTVLAEELTAIDQLKYVQYMQRVWSDNSVSCTVYYREEELEGIKTFLRENYSDGFKTLSFLKHNEHGFDQAPYEEITKEEYEALVASTRIITSVADLSDLELDDECASGACPIR